MILKTQKLPNSIWFNLSNIPFEFWHHRVIEGITKLISKLTSIDLVNKGHNRHLTTILCI